MMELSEPGSFTQYRHMILLPFSSYSTVSLGTEFTESVWDKFFSTFEVEQQWHVSIDATLKSNVCTVFTSAWLGNDRVIWYCKYNVQELLFRIPYKVDAVILPVINVDSSLEAEFQLVFSDLFMKT